MMKMVTSFAIIFAIFYFGIQAFCALTGKEKWNVSKLLAYSLVCAFLSGTILVCLVILF